MEDDTTSDDQLEPDVDSIRHVNQFGTLAVPVMEIACLPEKLDLVQNFFHYNGIEVFTNINPFI